MSSTSDFFVNCSICKIMWKNIVEPDRPQMTIWRMRIACWISKATNALSEYVHYLLLFHRNIGCTNTPQCVQRYTHIGCLVE